MMKDTIASMYEDGKITPNGVLNSISRGWLSIDEVCEILGKDNALEVSKSAKLLELSKACGNTITNGIDLELNGEIAHFNLSIEDQSNINNLFRVVELGGTEFPYQSDGGVCKIYNTEEIIKIYIAAQSWITQQTTYHNALKTYVKSLKSVDEILAITYGSELPEPYSTEVSNKLAVAKTQMDSILARLTGN